MLTVSRVLTEVNPQFHPDGARFLVRGYPKSKKHRRLKLGPQIVAKLAAHARTRADEASARTTCSSRCPPQWRRGA